MRPRTFANELGLVSRAKVVKRSGTCPCNKRAYTSKKLAKANAAKRSRETGEIIEAYHCYAGHCYHIGHPPEPFDFEADRARAAS